MKTRIPWTKILREYTTSLKNNPHKSSFLCFHSATFLGLWNNPTIQPLIRARATAFLTATKQLDCLVFAESPAEQLARILFATSSHEIRLAFLQSQTKQKKP